MDSKNNKDTLVNEKLDEVERSVSLCTLCVLETGGGDSDQISPSFSPTLTPNDDESNFDSLKHDELRLLQKDPRRTNYLSQFGDQAMFDEIKKNITIEKKMFDSRNHDQRQNNNNNNNNDYMLTPNFDESDNVVELSRSYKDLLKRLDTAGNIQSLGKLSQEHDTENQSENSVIYSSSDTLSLELEIASKISKNNINQAIINDADCDKIDNPKNVENSLRFNELEPQVPACKELPDNDIANSANNENLVSVMNPILEAVRCYDSAIRDNEIPRKRQKFDATECTNDSSVKIMLKREKINEPIEPDANIPRKKPKIIDSKILKFPVKQLLLRMDKIISTTNVSKDIAQNENCLMDTRDFRAATHKILEIQNDSTLETDKNDCTLKKVENLRQFGCNDDDRASRVEDKSGSEIRKIENNEETANNDDSKNANATAKTPMKPSNPPSYPALCSKTAVPRRMPSLSMLQHKFAVNSKRLIDQANEMRQLSLFIDEMKQDMSRSAIDDLVAISGKEANKSKKKFVSKSTQTTDPLAVITNNSTSKVPSVVNIIAPELKSKKMNKPRYIQAANERSILDHNWFRPTVTRNQNNDGEIVKNNDEILEKRPSASADDIVIQASGKIMKIAENQQKENSSLHYDPYYNPLRPRRWPKNRNNPKPLRNSHTREPLKKFPPLPIVVETPRKR